MILKNRIKNITSFFKKNLLYKIDESLDIIKSISSKNFIENIEISINTNIKNKEEFYFSGYLILPNNTGRILSIGIFVNDKDIDLAKKYGANYAGTKDIINIIKNNKKNNIDILLSTNESIKYASKCLKEIKYKNNIPNKKMGTIISDFKLINIIKNEYQVSYKNNKYGIIQAVLGKINLDNNILIENINSFISHIYNNRPNGIKNDFIKSIYISSTMGVGVKIYHKFIGTYFEKKIAR